MTIETLARTHKCARARKHAGRQASTHTREYTQIPERVRVYAGKKNAAAYAVPWLLLLWAFHHHPSCVNIDVDFSSLSKMAFPVISADILAVSNFPPLAVILCYGARSCSRESGREGTEGDRNMYRTSCRCWV